MKKEVEIIDQDITKNYKKCNLKSIYLTEENAEGYRNYDDKPYDRYAEIFGQKISDICRSYQKGIKIMDLACGTGRYFHRLNNVENLHGVDFSMPMLKKAKEPTRIEGVNWWTEKENLLLFCNTADDFCKNSESEYYNFIYCIGAMAEYGYPEGIFPTQDLFYDIKRSLTPDGTFMFTVNQKNYSSVDIKIFLKNSAMSNLDYSIEKVSYLDWKHSLVIVKKG